jgi:transcriptional regulator with XRE-family HTH domain
MVRMTTRIERLPVLHAVGGQIRARRKAWGWTQQDLADRVGMKPESISRIETSTVLPDLATLARIADAFGVSPGAFLGGSAEVNADPEGLPGWSSLSDADRRVVRHLVERLAPKR